MTTVRQISSRVLCVFVLILFIIMPAAAQDVFEAVPSDALFAVRVNNLDYTIGQIDQFLMGILPMPNMVSMMARMQLANMLGDPNLGTINMAGQAAIFGVAQKSAEANSIPAVHVCGLFPVNDYAKFIASNKPGADGLTTVGNWGLLAAKAGNYAMLGKPDDRAAILAASKTTVQNSLASTLNSNQRAAAAKARILAFGNIQQAQKLYGPMILSKIDEARKTMPVKDANFSAQFSQIMTVYMDLFKTLMTESKNISIAINPKADALALSVSLTAIEGTEMAKTFKAPPAVKGPSPLLGYLPENMMMSVAWQVNKPFAIQKYTMMIDMFAPLLGPKFTPEEKTKVVNLVKDSFNSLGQSLVYSVSLDPNSKTTFNAIYAFEVTDAAAFQKTGDTAMEMLKAPYMVDFLKSFGVKISYDAKKNAEQHSGVSIDVTKVIIASTEPNNQMGQMMTKMYGENLTVKSAIVGNNAFCTIGSENDSRINKLIDTAKAGGPKTVNAEFKNAMAFIPDSNHAQCTGTYNYLRASKAMPAMMPAMPFNMDAFRQVATKSSMAFDANIGNGDITLNVAIPKQHILEWKSAFEMMQKQRSQGMSQPQK